MASLVLLLSELVRHHNTNPDYWLTLPLPSPPPPPPPSASAVAKSLSSKCQNNMSRICVDETVMDEFLKESRVCVDLVWP